MRKLFKLSYVALIGFTISSCSPEGLINLNEFQLTNTTGTGNTSAQINLFAPSFSLKTLAEPTETFVFSAASASRKLPIRSRSGVSLSFDGQIFADAQGNRITTGDIELSFRAVLKPSQMLLNDRPTNTVADGLLESYGEFHIKATQNGNRLTLAPGESIQLYVPSNTKAPRRMPLWLADTTELEVLEGLNARALRTRVTQEFKTSKGAMWSEMVGSEAHKDEQTNTLSFDIKELDKWVNADVLQKDENTKRSVFIHFTRNFNPTAFHSLAALQPSGVYFKPEGANMLLRFYRPILNAPEGKQGFYSDENTIPVGMRGTVLAFSIVGNKIYMEKRAIEIGQTATAQGSVHFDFSPSEVSQSVFLDAVRSLDTL
jgi:hypothetical protein